MIWVVLLWVSIGLVVYSYVVYPLLLSFLSRGKSYNHKQYGQGDELPTVTIAFAAYNEEAVIKEKLESIFQSEYPADKLDVLVGSDGSTDRTDELVQGFGEKNCRLIRLGGRNGKSNVLNHILPEAKGELLILTDANIIFKPEMVGRLIRHFADPSIGLVGANVLNKGLRADGISVQESHYIGRENNIKEMEGRLWGTMAGAFGACYAVRRSLFPPIPRNFLMEDFYVTMSVIKGGYHAICDLEAKCMEDVSNQLIEEYKRKIRISAGNFQNLGAFKSLLWPPNTGVSFSFLSHKVLRWLGPFFIFLALLANVMLVLGTESVVYRYLLLLQLLGILSPVLDFAISRIGVHVPPLRFISYFYTMNLALFAGFVKYVKGIRTNAWEPTLRNQ